MVIGLAIGGGGLLVVGSVVGMYFAFSGGDAGQPNAIAASAAASASAPDDAATDSPGDAPDGANVAANGADAPLANGNGAAAAPGPGAANSAKADGSAPAMGLRGGNRQLSAAQRQAIAEHIRNNPDAKAAMAQSVEENKDDLQRVTKWTPEMLEEFAADQKLPPDQRRFYPNGQRKRPGDTPPAESKPAQQPVVVATTAQPVTQPAPAPAETAVATQDAPAVNPEEEAAEAIKEVGGKLDLDSDRRVESVQLRSLEELSDDDLVHLQAFKNIEKLDLGFSPIGDEGLAHLAELTQLKGLNLAGTSITNDGLAHLTGLKNLEHLSVQQTEISNRGIKQIGLKQLAKALPNCNIEQ
jgi:hypothetical protein